MKIKTGLLFAVLAAGVGFAPRALAHERDVFNIGGQAYQFVVGSLNEPVIVDDKSGVDFTLSKLKSAGDASGTPVSGAEQSLQVEISAGDRKKILNLAPVWNKPGSYSAPFYPTVPTAYQYRFFGSLNNVPVDISFSCSQSETAEQAADTRAVELSADVTRLSKTGAFGCPAPRADFGFPEPLLSDADVAARLDRAGAQNGKTSPIAIAALAVSVCAIVVARLGRGKK